MLQDFAEVAVGAIVKAGLDKVEVAGCVNLLEEDADVVIVGNVHFVEVGIKV
jgi:hypothetical protein